ncbi:uncharacterized protein LAESUDRAFT_183911 [Laetiporus sulphureus 93-53]|uniref:F-box domain-containing protein n=1 Tax=Laetiporus sulphureus 93-53 TaxID=1314785 RepID=A0A165E3X2_9APHY|nr:uncharacterized protein LAESUDRAFT_183911 [Laetiporus sulphureus 93-53]KZT06200.1 hypothetical protein LAESUDRAFT_183911 [Laetiporus sulphureus 93-53]
MTKRAEKPLMLTLASLRRAQNSYSQTARLPTEVLEEIFLHGSPSYSRDNLADDWVSMSAQWVYLRTITHVCHRWREVALDIPKLWTHFDDSCKAVQQVFLQRSASAEISIATWTKNPSPFLQMLLTSHAPRLQELRLRSYDDSDDAFQFTVNAVQLLRLKLGGFIRSNTQLSTTLFAACAPSLQQLCLERIHWVPNQKFEHLTALYLETPQAPLRDLLNLLSNCCKLSDLFIWDPKFTFNTDDLESRTVSLPKLRRFAMSDDSIHGARAVISALNISPDAAIQLGQRCVMGQPLLNVLSQLPLVGATTKVFVDPEFVIGTSSLSGIRGPYDIIAALPLPQIQELWLPAPTEITSTHVSDHFIRLFPRMLSLETLVITDVLRIEDTLVGLMHPGGNKIRPKCPKLHTLRVMFQSWRYDPPPASVVKLLAHHQQVLQLSHLSIEYLPTYADGAKPHVMVMKTMYDHHFPSVEYKALQNTPEMTIPQICFGIRGHYWPSFLDRRMDRFF